MKEFWPISTGWSDFRSQEEPKVATPVTAAPATTKSRPNTAVTARIAARRRLRLRSSRFRLRLRRA
jgi:hypothetical protein